MIKPPHIMVLGATGMLGHTVYQYLKSSYPKTTWGTTRQDSQGLFNMSTSSIYQSMQAIIKSIKTVDYVINAVAVIQKEASIEESILVNALFPHQLETLSHEYNFKLLHVSTDAVFAENVGLATEHTSPNPNTIYGCSKYLGEVNGLNSITFRTSIIGPDPNKKKGLLEKVFKYREIELNAREKWNGCTTLQFAQLCKEIIKSNRFQELRDRSAIYHFVPLHTSKSKIVHEFKKLVESSCTIKSTDKKPIKRVLSTAYEDILDRNMYNTSLVSALKEVLSFENYKYFK